MLRNPRHGLNAEAGWLPSQWGGPKGRRGAVAELLRVGASFFILVLPILAVQAESVVRRGMAERLLDFASPLDVGLLDNTVNAFHGAGNNEQVMMGKFCLGDCVGRVFGLGAC